MLGVVRLAVAGLEHAQLSATIVRPLRSIRPMISPTSPRSTASGLQRMRVRSAVMERRAGTVDESPKAPAGAADERQCRHSGQRGDLRDQHRRAAPTK